MAPAVLGLPSSALTPLTSSSVRPHWPVLPADYLWGTQLPCSGSEWAADDQYESPALHSVVTAKAPLSQEKSSSGEGQTQAGELGFCSSGFHLMCAHLLRSMGSQTKSLLRHSHGNFCSLKRNPLVCTRENC